MRYLLKSVLLLNFIVLSWFTALQFNDPDSLIWIGIYGISALVPITIFFERSNQVLFWTAFLSCALAAAVEVPGAYTYLLHRHEEALMQSMNPEKPYIEEAREFLGSLIALSLLLISQTAKRLLVTNNAKQ